MTPGRVVRFALLLAVAGCGPPAPAALTLVESRTVDRWLLCEECTDGELDSVVALEDRAVPALKEALLKGPSAERRANMRQQAENMYRLMRDTVVILRERYLAHYDTNFVSSYQSRAARALRRIDTPEARDILLEALRNDSLYRPDVRRILGRSAGAVLSLIAGDSQHAPLDSFVKVNPEVLVSDSASGAGLGGVRVRFFVDSGGGRVFDSVRVTDAAGKALVRWRLGPAINDTFNLMRVIAAGRAVRVRAHAHEIGLRVVIVTQPSVGRVGQAIAPPVRIAVQDAWGATQRTLNQRITVTLVGTGIESVHNVVAGVAHLPALAVPMAGSGFRFRFQTAGAASAISDSFDITP